MLAIDHPDIRVFNNECPPTSHKWRFGAGVLGRIPAAPPEPEAAGNVRGASGVTRTWEV